MAIEKHSKESWLDQFSSQRPDLFFPSDWTDEEKEVALEEVRPTRIKTAMFASIPMTCQASACPIKERCPLYQKGQAPRGKPCPYEQAMVQHYVRQLISDLSIDEDNLTEV